MLKIVEYVREDGKNPFRTWFDDLHPQAAAKIATAVVRLELGNTSQVKGIGTIAEYRIDWGPGYRIYFGRDGATVVVLLGGGTKKTQRSDIARAAALWAEYQVRKRSARATP